MKNALKYMDNILAERRSQWYKYFDMKRLYGNSLVSRFYAEVYDDQKSAGWIEKWKKIWSGRKLLIVEGELTRLGVGNDLFDDVVNIRRVLCPSKSAFSVYDKILRNVLEVHEKEELILIALGPTATILAYDLAEKGVQALDHGGTWFQAITAEVGYAKTRYAYFNGVRMTLTATEPMYLDSDNIVDGYYCLWTYEGSEYEAGTFTANSTSANSPWNTMSLRFNVY